MIYSVIIVKYVVRFYYEVTALWPLEIFDNHVFLGIALEVWFKFFIFYNLLKFTLTKCFQKWSLKNAV